jgi:2'-5' RNA ligase
MSQEIRTFVAVELPERLKASLVELQGRLKRQASQGAVRWTAPEGIHLTLKFLGQTPTGQIDDIVEALRLACAPLPSFPYTASELGCFPNLRRPRVIWVGVQEPAGALAALQKAVETACAGLGFERERRAFHPHLTLGRLQRRATSGDTRAMSDVVQRTQATSLGTETAHSISLIRSDLRPTGAVYTTLQEIELTGG